MTAQGEKEPAMEAGRAYVAVTDSEWFRFLRDRSREEGPLEEVNFWKPWGLHGLPRHLPPGTPFLFKLKSPFNAIAGVGFYARSTMVPLSIAWKAFEEANGAQDEEELRRIILGIRSKRKRPEALDTDPEIGCVMLSEPSLFQEDDWIPQPSAFQKNIETGVTVSLADREWAPVWDRCLAASLERKHDGRGLVVSDVAKSPRFGSPQTVHPRLGQGTFRLWITDAYDRACAVTGEHSLPVLDAAHIRPYKKGGEHAPRNGLLLRTDIHRLYDQGYVTVTPDLRFRVSPRLRERWGNGRAYDQFKDLPVKQPKDASEQPDTELLAWHAREVFLR